MSSEGKFCSVGCVGRRFGTKCGGCGEGILPNDLVRRARQCVYHLKCFVCSVCRKQLSTGEQLYVVDDTQFICKDDFIASKLNTPAAGTACAIRGLFDSPKVRFRGLELGLSFG